MPATRSYEPRYELAGGSPVSFFLRCMPMPCPAYAYAYACTYAAMGTERRHPVPL